MPETYLSPSSSSVETDDGELVYEFRDVQREGGERWKLVAAPYGLLDYREALMDDGSILVQALPDEASDLLQQKEELVDIDQLIESTRLSRRQAELYAWKVKAGLSIKDAAKEMEISEGNASQKWDAVKRKIREAEQDRTAELEI